MVGVDAGWAGPTDDRWHTGAIDFPAGQEDPDGGEWLLELLLDDSPEAYRRFAEEYCELITGAIKWGDAIFASVQSDA